MFLAWQRRSLQVQVSGNTGADNHLAEEKMSGWRRRERHRVAASRFTPAKAAVPRFGPVHKREM
jgi:hypothetical protein